MRAKEHKVTHPAYPEQPPSPSSNSLFVRLSPTPASCWIPAAVAALMHAAALGGLVKRKVQISLQPGADAERHRGYAGEASRKVPRRNSPARSIKARRLKRSSELSPSAVAPISDSTKPTQHSSGPKKKRLNEASDGTGRKAYGWQIFKIYSSIRQIPGAPLSVVLPFKALGDPSDGQKSGTYFRGPTPTTG